MLMTALFEDLLVLNSRKHWTMKMQIVLISTKRNCYSYNRTRIFTSGGDLFSLSVIKTAILSTVGQLTGDN